jgi:mannose-1-phosphate guanylyltransferase
MRERVTLTLDADLLGKIDQSIDGHTIKNRSHAVELLLFKAMGSEHPKKAIILAGGKSNVLKPVIGSTPHILAPIKNKPVIEHVIELFKKYGVSEVIISLHHSSEKVKKHFEGKDLGIKLTFIEEKFPLGTAGPLRLAKSHLTSTFFVANADELKNIDLTDMYNFHREHNGLATIALTTIDDPSKYGVANMTGNHILDFVEKPKKQNAPSNLINAGLYVMEPEVIDYIPDGFARFEYDVFPKLARESRLIGYSFSGQWFALDSVEDYKNADKKWEN